MRAFFLLSCLVLTGCVTSKPPATPPPTLDTVEAVAQDYWEVLLAESPMWATQLGDRRFDAMLPNLSTRAIQDTLRKKKELRHRLQALNAGYLMGESLLTARLLAVMLRDDEERAVCRSELWEVNQLGGWHLALADLATYQPVDSASAAAAYVTRLNGAGPLMDQHIENLRTGLANGLVSARVVVDRVVEQVRDLLAQPAASAPYLAALDRTDALSQAERAQLKQDIIAATESSINPALRKYLKFLETELTPHARLFVGLSAQTDGEACYHALSTEHGGRTIRADEWHAMGMVELERLEAEMNALARAAGYGSAEAYAKALADDPNEHTSNPAALVQHGQDLVMRAQKALPQAFVGWSEPAVVVRAVEPFREKASPAGFYEPAPADGSHPAVYYVNTYKPATRPLYNLEALTFHEAVPGHHLQIAMAQALHGLPLVRRNTGPTAYVEGWGLYAEMLADELGLYSSPAARFGMLNFQAWRASRLVVDTGLHALGWTRDQAIDFMQRHLALPKQDIINEVDRYIVMPGQALAYMSGRMELQNLRSQAQKKLGMAFTLQAFHREVLAHGAVPLPVLRDVMGVWLSTTSGSL